MGEMSKTKEMALVREKAMAPMREKPTAPVMEKPSAPVMARYTITRGINGILYVHIDIN